MCLIVLARDICVYVCAECVRVSITVSVCERVCVCVCVRACVCGDTNDLPFQFNMGYVVAKEELAFTKPC